MPKYVRRLTVHLSITYKMQRYIIFFITVNDLDVSGGFSAHHQELKTVHRLYFILSSLTYKIYSVYSFELLMMGGGTA
jgi:hypothetical protein